MSGKDIRSAIRIGLIAGLVATSVSAIGMVQTFNERYIITGILTLGQILLFSAPLIGGFIAVDPEKNIKVGPTLIKGLIVGVLTAVPLIILIFLPIIFPGIRDILVNVSPALINILTFGQGPVVGSLILAVVMTVLGAVGSLFHLLPEKVERPLFSGVVWVLGFGLFAEILINILRPVLPRQILRLLFGTAGITLLSAVVIFVVAVAATAWWESSGRERQEARRERRTPEQQKRARIIGLGAGIILVLIAPWVLGIYLTEIMDIVGIFVIMGLGLNIVVGFAGLLDLGYVAFFAIGAYTMGLLTTSGELGIAGWSFWMALPVAVLASTVAGIILGVPVLRMRGDYLAIVTLGFGEIIRVLALSDLLKPVIGGAQGILQIGKPEILSFTFVQPQHFYYLIVAGALLAAFVSWRLRDARLGRQWMAMREDEDVAEAIGIRLVNTKLLAFAIGAAFSGLAGAIFASRLSSIFPHSFNILISINVLCLIIVGGLGSLPGVVLGAFVLVGLPELLREFAEYRLLLYGALLIATMLLRPEGLWPSPIRKRELHAGDEEAAREGPVVHREDVHPLME
jgi:branched-chain amino acid transport system permease protein